MVTVKRRFIFHVFMASAVTIPAVQVLGQSMEPKSFGTEPTFEAPDVYRYEELPPLEQRKEIKKTKVKFRGYGKYRKDILHLCFALYRDGRSLEVSDLGGEFKKGVKECPACKPFYRAIFADCKKKPKVKNEIKKSSEESSGEEAQVLEPKPQYEPSPEVLDIISRLYMTLLEDTHEVDLHIQAADHFSEQLRVRNGKLSTAAENYYDTLATYILAPFQMYREKRDRLIENEKREREQREREFMLDSLTQFDAKEGGVDAD